MYLSALAVEEVEEPGGIEHVERLVHRLSEDSQHQQSLRVSLEVAQVVHRVAHRRYQCVDKGQE